MFRLPILPMALLLAAMPLTAVDTVMLEGDRSLEGWVIQQDDANVVLRMSAGTITIPRSRVRGVVSRDDPKPPAPPKSPEAGPNDARLPAWNDVVTALAAQPWAKGLHQIPATVIDVGVMRCVPYTSYRCGPGSSYEVNVYGDPADPVCLEFGIYGSQATDSRQQEQAVEFAARAYVSNELNRAILRGLKRAQDTATHGGLTMETTPPTADDAYGAWWVAVYFADRVEKARASKAEVEGISVSAAQVAAAQPVEPTDWSASDVRAARAASPSAASGSSAGGSYGGGRVYVRAYTRKDGTYVHSYSRRK